MNTLEALWHFAKYCYQQFTTLNERLDTIMATVQVDQAQIDALTQTLSDIAANLTAEIATLKTQLPAADFSGVDAQVAALQNLETPATTPAPDAGAAPTPA
jgi:Tfp pilus assembly protein PilV